jgi:WD40 repeat protein
MSTPHRFVPTSTTSSSSYGGNNNNGGSGGNSNVAGQIEVLELTAASQRDKYQHQQQMLEMEAKKRAFLLLDVPTLPSDVKAALRALGLPVRFFGENLMNVRDRLKIELAKQELLKEQQYGPGETSTNDMVKYEDRQDDNKRQQGHENDIDYEEEEEITKYSRALPELIRAREVFAIYSLDRARQRLETERNYRLQWARKRARLIVPSSSSSSTTILLKNNNTTTSTEDTTDATVADKDDSVEEVTRIDDDCAKTYKALRNFGLEGSQYGDDRPISSIATTTTTSFSSSSSSSQLIATGSWSGTIKLWDGSSPELTLLVSKSMAHEDRIMGLAFQRPQQQLVDSDNDNDSGPVAGSSSAVSSTSSVLMATASIDMTAKIWKIRLPQQDDDDHDDDQEGKPEHDIDTNDDGMDIDDRQQQRNRTKNTRTSSTTTTFHIEEVAHLKGHARRLAKIAFHPKGDHVATTSFDHTWRLWDIEKGIELLLQDGHYREVYGIGFHPDGSMCSTTDYGGIVQCWDVRTGKSIHHFVGHAKRVLCTEFHPNGYHLATAGDDGTIKIWDLRQRKQFVSIPAHSNIITQLQFDRYHNGEFVVSSSFDGTAKVWSTRDYKMLSTLRGHEGKVMGVDVLKDSIVTSGFDKTLKLWS